MDLGHNIYSFMALNAQTVTGTTVATSSAFDTKGYEGAVITFFLGAKASDGATTITFTVTECDTSGGSYDTVSSSSTVITSTNTSTELSLDLVPRERYLKVVATPSCNGAETYIIAGAFAVLGGAILLPV